MKITILAYFGSLIVLAAAPEVLKIGEAGSVASFPPPEADAGRQGDTVAATLEMELHVEPAAIAKRAVPTNQWWTNLLVGQTPGALWASPLVVEPEPDAVAVYFPKEWNGDGREMIKGNPLRVYGLPKKPVTKVSDDGPVVVADFEGSAYPEGWKIMGSAFGKGPAPGILPGQTPMGGFSGSGLANTFLPDDSATGSLTSAPFAICRDYLHFLIGGGRDAENLTVCLKVDGEVVAKSTGMDSEHLEPDKWDVKRWRGKTGVLEFKDEATGGWRHLLADQFVLDDKESADAPPSRFVRAADTKALRWGDWTLGFRQASEAGEGFDVTLGRGMPFAWFECRDVIPVLGLPADAALTDDKGAVVEVGNITGSFTVQIEGSCFGVHLPRGTKVSKAEQGVALELPKGGAFFTISALPEPAAMAKLAPAAFSIPRGSRVEWKYDPAHGAVATRWRLALEPLAGGKAVAVQGWLPHHLLHTRQSLAFNGLEYMTPRGVMRCATGNDFSVVFPFSGLVPALPMPQEKVDDYDPQRLAKLLEAYSGNVKFADDTYWGGKDLLRCAQAAMIAKLTDSPAADALRVKLEAALADWFTWTPGEKAHYFTWYPKWGGLVGFKDSYGSFRFTDQHFHFGYFTTSAAIMAALDPEFLKKYGEIARLVAKGYANWERDDPRFPSFRTFDFWEGHSWAGGFSSPGGNNQESSSEAIQSWAGVFLLGSALDDSEMQAAGAMGYAMERASTEAYWLDLPGFENGSDASTMPPTYDKSVTGILFANGNAYATYFSGDPAWIHGIQWFPASPWQDHLAGDRDFTRNLYRSMREERTEWFAREAEKEPDKRNADPESIDAMGPALGNVVLGFLAISDPDEALTQSGKLAEAGSRVVSDPEHIVPLAEAAARSVLGQRLRDCRTSLPTSACYGRPEDFRAVLFNPSLEPVDAVIFTHGKEVAKVRVPAGELLVHPVKSGE